MQCTEFESALQDAADRRALLPFVPFVPCDNDAPDGWLDLRRHADACPRCRSHWRQFHLVDDALRSWGRQTFDVHLTDAVMARWQHEREADQAVAAAAHSEPSTECADRSGHRLRAAVYATVIAALLIVLIGPSRWFDPTESVQRPPSHPPAIPEQSTETEITPLESTAALTAAASKVEVPEIAPDEEPVPLRSLVENAGTAYRTVADDTAKTWTSVKQLVSAWTPPTGTSSDMPAEPTPQETESVSGASEPWLDDLRRDLQPVGRDMTRPLEFLREALPIPSATL